MRDGKAAEIASEVSDLRSVSLATLGAHGGAALDNTLRRVVVMTPDDRHVPVAAFQSSI